MSARRVLALMRKSLNPRNPYIAFAILGPLVFAAIFQLVFSIWQVRPKVALYEGGDRAVSRELEASGAVELLAAGSADVVVALVEGKKADVGVVLSEEAKQRLASGERTPVDFLVNGESLAKSRAIALAALTGAVRSISPFIHIRGGESGIGPGVDPLSRCLVSVDEGL